MRKMILSATCLIMLSANAFADDASKEIIPKPAMMWANPAKLDLLDVTRVGDRIVAVGEHGVAILSDDGGKTFRQAKSMPVDCTLTAVTFVDDKNGWAVGHWGVIVATADGGEHWQLQRSDTSVDQPLLSVAFKNANEGWAVGLWSAVLQTQDGGKTWTREHLQAPPGSTRADKNLNKIFLDKNGTIFVASEGGIVLRSSDSGKSWDYLTTGYAGSLWTGMATSGGAIYVGGLRGSLYRSTDNGASWNALDSGSKASITGLVEYAGTVTGVALDGYTFSGNADATVFVAQQRESRAALTAAVVNKAGKLVIVSKNGVVAN